MPLLSHTKLAFLWISMPLSSPIQTIFFIAHFNVLATYLTPVSINLLMCNVVKIFILQGY